MSLKRLNARGDTIVEVLIALAVLSFTLVTCYSIVNRSLIAARNSQEHSEALEYLNSQIELTRSLASDPTLFSQTVPFCIVNSGTLTIKPYAGSTPPECIVGLEGFYSLQVIHSTTSVGSATQDIFSYQVTWPGPGYLGPQKEALSYKLYQVVGP